MNFLPLIEVFFGFSHPLIVENVTEKGYTIVDRDYPTVRAIVDLDYPHSENIKGNHSLIIVEHYHRRLKLKDYVSKL